jgi:hypothetical protein
MCEWNTLLTFHKTFWTICVHLRDMYPFDGAYLILNHLGALSELFSLLQLCPVMADE